MAIKMKSTYPSLMSWAMMGLLGPRLPAFWADCKVPAVVELAQRANVPPATLMHVEMVE
jgi:hypothetical protein